MGRAVSYKLLGEIPTWLMTSTYITRIHEGYTIVVDKHILLEEGLTVGDYIEVTIRKVVKTPKSESGGPYGL